MKFNQNKCAYGLLTGRLTIVRLRESHLYGDLTAISYDLGLKDTPYTLELKILQILSLNNN